MMVLTERTSMHFARWIYLPAMAILAGGCVTAHYRYAVEVPGVDAAAPAKVELRWKGGSRTFTVKSDDCTLTRFTEVMQPMGCVFADIPRGLDVRVTRDGYKPWQHHYQYVDEDFRTKKWDSFVREDVIQLESVYSQSESRQIDGTPVYR